MPKIAIMLLFHVFLFVFSVSKLGLLSQGLVLFSGPNPSNSVAYKTKCVIPVLTFPLVCMQWPILKEGISKGYI